MDPELAFGLLQELRRQNVPCTVAPYEADAQLAFLARNGEVDLVISEDSDMLVYECPRVRLPHERRC